MKNFYTKKSCYTTLPNAFAQDHCLSIEARGLGLLIFSLPDDWVFRQVWFYEKAGGQGLNRRKTVVKALNELISFGYLSRVQDRSKGKFDEAIWLFDPEGNAQAELKAILAVSTNGTNGTVSTDSACPFSAGTVSATIKEESKKEEKTKKENTPKSPKEGIKTGRKLKISTLSQIADKHRMTISTIEDFVEFRQNSGGIENAIAFKKYLTRELSKPYSDESIRLEEWFEVIQTQSHIIDHLVYEFLSMHWFDRRKCREQAKDDHVLKMNNVTPMDVVIEIAFQRAESKRRERMGGAA